MTHKRVENYKKNNKEKAYISVTVVPEEYITKRIKSSEPVRPPQA